MTDHESVRSTPDPVPDPALALLVERVKRRIRQEVESQRLVPPARFPRPAPTHADVARRATEWAQQVVHPGDSCGARPDAARRGGVRGWLAGLAGKLVLKAVWFAIFFVAERQSLFNRLTLMALAEGERARAELEARVCALEAALREARARQGAA